jgi:hypothetical protein
MLHYTYRQEFVRCFKPQCRCAKGDGHGPYWYAYWRDESGTLRKKYIGRKLRRLPSEPSTTTTVLPKTAPSPVQASTVPPLLDVVRQQMDRSLGLAFVPRVVRVLGPDISGAHALLLQAANRGEIELRPESGLGRLTPEELSLCLPGPQGSRLSWIRIP